MTCSMIPKNDILQDINWFDLDLELAKNQKNEMKLFYFFINFTFFTLLSIIIVIFISGHEIDIWYNLQNMLLWANNLILKM